MKIFAAHMDIVINYCPKCHKTQALEERLAYELCEPLTIYSSIKPAIQ